YYGQPVVIAQGHWTLATSGFFDGVVGALVQGFFAHRIHAISQSWVIPMFSWTLSLLALAATTAIMVLSLKLDAAIFGHDFKWLITSGLVLLHAVDLINTVSLCWYLRAGKTGVVSTDGVLHRLTIWAIETGVIVSLSTRNKAKLEI
ncbi:hypothetical protein HWV62_33389, partial [Athelia sp. TMB]